MDDTQHQQRPTLIPIPKRPKKQRTPEEQRIIDERMRKLRDAKAKKRLLSVIPIPQSNEPFFREAEEAFEHDRHEDISDGERIDDIEATDEPNIMDPSDIEHSDWQDSGYHSIHNASDDIRPDSDPVDSVSISQTHLTNRTEDDGQQRTNGYSSDLVDRPIVFPQVSEGSRRRQSGGKKKQASDVSEGLPRHRNVRGHINNTPLSRHISSPKSSRSRANTVVDYGSLLLRLSAIGFMSYIMYNHLFPSLDPTEATSAAPPDDNNSMVVDKNDEAPSLPSIATTGGLGGHLPVFPNNRCSIPLLFLR